MVVSARALAFVTFSVAATLVGLAMIDRASTVFVLLGAAITAAVIAAPAVRGLARWLPRGAAIGLLTVAGMVGVFTLLTIVGRDLRQQERTLRTTLHQAVSDLPADSSASDVARELRLDDRIDDVLDGATGRVVLAENDPVAIAGLVGKVVVVGVLAAFMIAGGRRLVDGAVQFVRRTSIREQLHASLNSAAARAGGFLRRTLVVSFLHGCVAAAVARVFDLPGPISVGAWVAMMSTVPILGSLLGWAPIIVLGWVHDVSSSLLIAVALIAVLADRIARARWVHRALRVGPLLTIVGVAAGLSTIGVSGAILGLFVVAFASAMASYRTHLAAALSDLVDDPADRALPNSVDTVPPDASGGSPAAPATADSSSAVQNVMSERRDGARIIRLRLSGRTAFTAATIVITFAALLGVASSMQPFIVWFAVAGFIAAGLDRPISGMHRRWNIPRIVGTSLMLGCAVATVFAVIVIGGPSISDSTQTIAKDAPETVRSMESLPLVGRILGGNGAAERVEEFINSLPSRLESSDLVDRVAAAAGDGVVGAFWTISIMLAILWDGPRLVAAIRQRVPVRHRARSIRFGRAAYKALSNVVAAAAFVAALNGSVVMTLAIVLGIPLAPILGLWAAFWNFIPQVGGFIGALPLVALGFGQGPLRGVIALVVFLTYQTFENHVIQPFVGSRAVHLPPLVVMVGALFGGVVGGFAGALLAGPTLGVAKIALDEFRHDAERIEDRIDHRPADAVSADTGAPPGQSEFVIRPAQAR